MWSKFQENLTIQNQIIVRKKTQLYKNLLLSVTMVPGPNIERPLHPDYTSPHVVLYSNEEVHEYDEYLRNPDREQQKTSILAILLGVKVPSNDIGNIRCSPHLGPRAGMAGKQSRMMPTKVSYTRMFTFGDLSSKSGATFVVLEDSRKQHLNLFDFKTKVEVGGVFFIREPSPDPVYISEQCPIVTTVRRIIPIEAIHQFPSVPIGEPAPKVSRFFFVKNVKSVSVTYATVRRTLCTGTLCDRREPDKQLCGCWHTDAFGGKNHVLTIGVRFVFGDGSEREINPWSSLKLTKLLFNGDIPANADTENKLIDEKIREKLDGLVNHVNNGDGWSVLGWHRLGLQQDKSDSDTLVFADESKFHLELLTPSSLSKVDIDANHFSIDPTELYTAT